MTRADRLLIAALAAACLLAWPLTAAARGDARQVEISAPTGTTRLSLEPARTLIVQGASGELVVVVEDGSVRVSEAECPDHVCVSTGRVSAPGAIVACVPNGVVLRVDGSDDELDARVR